MQSKKKSLKVIIVEMYMLISKKSKHESSNPDNPEKNKAGSLELWPSMIPLPSHAPFALAPLPHVACGILVLQPRTRDLTWGHSTEDAES